MPGSHRRSDQLDQAHDHAIWNRSGSIGRIGRGDLACSALPTRYFWTCPKSRVAKRSGSQRATVDWSSTNRVGLQMIVEIGMVVWLKSWRSCEWSCGGRAYSGREELLVGLQPRSTRRSSCIEFGRVWSENLGDPDDRVDLIGGENPA